MQISTLTFSFPLHPGDTRAFRAAVVEQVGLGNSLFHGHDNSEPGVTKYTNQYPLMKFGVFRGRAYIMGMGAGAQAILRQLIPALPDQLYIAGRPCNTSDFKLTNRQWEPEILSEYRTFGLYRWIALNNDNYTSWKEHEGRPAARRLILDRCLTGQLRNLAKQTNLADQRERIVANTLRVDKVKRIEWKSAKLIAFNVVAEANFNPYYGLGLGRVHSFGFGEVCSERQYQKLNMIRKKTKQHST
ncbi:MAG: CRISPR-associated endonuclease Cas6 [Bacteroidota bacterium]